MKRSIRLTALIVSVVLGWGCSKPDKDISINPTKLHDAVTHLTDVIVHDIFSPPVASRIYAYSTIAAYEVMAAQDSSYQSLAGQVRGLEPLPSPEGEVNHEVAAIQAFLLVGKALIFSEKEIENYIDSWHKELDEMGISESVKTNSITYGQAVAKHILNWADKDNYKQTRTFEKFNVKDEAGRWQPTPPAYIEAIEPHWSKIRPFVLDSANQFVPDPPAQFTMDKSSQFYKEVKEVFDVVKNASPEQSEIAGFWDCNPYVMNVHGHVMFATKKITPGGHWMGIAKIACQKENANLMKSAEAYAMTAISLADGFISCWDEKYRSNLIRPETVINKYMDETWVPLLQTPPFPEYTSGHSVISSAAAVTLTKIFGDNFNFVDSTEVKFGLPVRSFNSFYEASSEAAISRLYGGIHYRMAIEEGVEQGKKVGQLVVERIRTRKENKLTSN